MVMCVDEPGDDQVPLGVDHHVGPALNGADPLDDVALDQDIAPEDLPLCVLGDDVGILDQ